MEMGENPAAELCRRDSVEEKTRPGAWPVWPSPGRIDMVPYERSRQKHAVSARDSAVQ